MDWTFKGMAGTMGNKPWTVGETTITRGSNVYQISDIIKIENKPPKSRLNNGIFQITIKGGKAIFGGVTTLVLPYHYDQTVAATQAFQYLCEKTGNKELAAANNIYERLLRGEEIRKRCNVCGNIMCYNLEDYRKNEELKRSVSRDRGLAALSALSVSIMQSEVTSGNADRKASQIRDFDKCPNCNSSDLSELTEEEFKATTAAKNTLGAASPLDELKKMKELLDLGIVTQEEFDAKKKQLLGL